MDISSITSLPDLGLHKVETDLRDDLEPTLSCLDVLRRSGALKWGTQKKVKYIERRKVKEVKPRTRFGGDSAFKISKVRGSSKLRKVKLTKIVQGRWSVKRCESAKKALLHVVREMGATRNKPVFRNELREEARKYIGDTGLLDHLLKHMAGKVFGEGNDRLVRRHNSDGVIEYWLEPAELALLRQEAGITDPYWVPPSGWKLGDPISDYMCDGQCKVMISQCKEEINLLKSQMEEVIKKTESQIEEVIKSMKKTESAQQEKYLDLQVQHEKLKDQVISMQEKENGKHVAAGAETGTKENTIRKSGLSICRPEGTFVLPKMVSYGGQYSNHSVPSDMSLPPQLIVHPSPTFPPPRPNFFCQQHPDSQRSIPRPSFSLPQSQAVLSRSPTQGMIYRPTARYPLEGKKRSGASAVLPGMNSDKRAVDIETDLTLASIKY